MTSTCWRVFVLLGIALTLTPAVSGQTERILYSFTNGSDGGFPQGGLVSDGKGNFYGTALGGSTSYAGVVFELIPNSSGGWTEQVIYSFTGYSGTGDGANPSSSLVFDDKGNLYGVTSGGGTLNLGTVYELSPSSNGTWTEKVLYSFAGGADGMQPYNEGVVLDSAGNVYGTTYVGGAYGHGMIYELIAGANGTWTEKILYNFQGLNDGGTPIGNTPVVDTAGNLYGVASQGGEHDYGVVYKLTPGAGGIWTETVLYNFPGGAGGASPIGSVVLDSSGNLFGTTTYTAYELVAGATGTWTRKVLHRFGGGKDGATALAGMVFDKAGNLYGTTSAGGVHRGVVYKLIPKSNGSWAEKILHRFVANGIDGYGPQYEDLIVDATGSVFGTTSIGGSSNAGVVFQIQP